MPGVPDVRRPEPADPANIRVRKGFLRSVDVAYVKNIFTVVSYYLIIVLLTVSSGPLREISEAQAKPSRRTPEAAVI